MYFISIHLVVSKTLEIRFLGGQSGNANIFYPLSYDAVGKQRSKKKIWLLKMYINQIKWTGHRKLIPGPFLYGQIITEFPSSSHNLIYLCARSDRNISTTSSPLVCINDVNSSTLFTPSISPYNCCVFFSLITTALLKGFCDWSIAVVCVCTGIRGVSDTCMVFSDFLEIKLGCCSATHSQQY